MTPLLAFLVWVIIVVLITVVILWLLGEAGLPPQPFRIIKLLIIVLAIVLVLWKAVTVLGLP